VELAIVPGFTLRLAPSVTLRPAGDVPVSVRRRDADAAASGHADMAVARSEGP
jgi:hypothetical protein